MSLSYYLGLDLNLSQKPEIVEMEQSLGVIGFAIYVKILLKLAQVSNYRLDEKKLGVLAYEFRVDENTVEKVVRDFNLFEFEDGYFFCPNVIDKMQLLEEKRQIASEAGKRGNAIRWGKIGLLSGSDRVAIKNLSGSDRNKEKEIKEIKERKVKEENKEIKIKENKTTEIEQDKPMENKENEVSIEAKEVSETKQSTVIEKNDLVRMWGVICKIKQFTPEEHKKIYSDFVKFFESHGYFNYDIFGEIIKIIYRDSLNCQAISSYLVNF